MSLRSWALKRHARGIARAQARTYGLCRKRDPDAPEKEILKRVLSSRLGYSSQDAEEMESRCKNLFDLCLFVIYNEVNVSLLDASGMREMREEVREEVRRILQARDPEPRGKPTYGITRTEPPGPSGQRTLANEGHVVATEESRDFATILVSVDKKDVHILKELRAITGMDLKEVGSLVDGCPAVIKEGISRTEAVAIKLKLEVAGATIHVTQRKREQG